ncbi:ABC transporter substrate-binding protein [Reinekea forsetii]|nr:ABC transporter substrate-binding protein [Reinekea forsetii]
MSAQKVNKNNSDTVRLGFIPLIDCAPFVIAQEKGFFEQEGVRVVLSKEASWASIRDKVAFNVLDGAHMLAALPLASSIGLGTLKAPMQSAFTLSQNGNAITVSNALFESMKEFAYQEGDIKSGLALKRLIETRNKKSLRFAMVYPYSSHHYLLRDWLAQANINPDIDVKIVVVPPVNMLTYLKEDIVDGYCVGEPWNSLAMEQGIGQMVTTGYDLWGNIPEKVLGVNEHWANQYPDKHFKIIRALHSACQWIDTDNHREELLNILSQPHYLNCTVAQLKYGFVSKKPQGEVTWPLEANQIFSGTTVNEPAVNLAYWLLTQMLRWQQILPSPELNTIVSKVYLPKAYNHALKTEIDFKNLSAFELISDHWQDEAVQGRVRISKQGHLSGFYLNKA